MRRISTNLWGELAPFHWSQSYLLYGKVRNTVTYGRVPYCDQRHNIELWYNIERLEQWIVLCMGKYKTVVNFYLRGLRTIYGS